MNDAVEEEPAGPAPEPSSPAPPGRRRLPGPGIFAVVASVLALVGFLRPSILLSLVSGDGDWFAEGRLLSWVSLGVLLSIVGLQLRRGPRRALAVRGLPWRHAACILALSPCIIIVKGALRPWLWWAYEKTGLFEPAPPDEKSSFVTAILEVRADMTVAAVLMLLASTAVQPAILEEVYHRGFLGRGLLARLGAVGGVLVSALIFAVMHFDPIQSALVMLTGIVTHMAYLWSRSLLAPMLLHFLNNSLAALISLSLGGAPIDRFTRVFLGPTWVHVLVAAASVVALLWLYRRLRAQWVLPDGTEWTPGYVTAEMPPAELGARIEQRTTSFPSVAVALAACFTFAGTIAWMSPAGSTEPERGEPVEVEATESASSETAAGKLAALVEADEGASPPERRLLLAVEAWREAESAGETWSPEVVNALGAAVRDRARVDLETEHWMEEAAFSLEGERIAAVYGDNVVRVFAADGESEPILLDGLERDISRRVRISPDGRWVLATTSAHSRLWDLSNEAEPESLGPVESVSFSRDSRRLAITTGAKIRIRSLGLGASEDVVLEDPGAFSAALSPDGRRLAAGVGVGVRVWDIGGRSRDLALGDDHCNVHEVTWSPDSRSLVLACDGGARILGADGSGQPLVLRHPGGVLTASFSPDGSQIVTGCSDGRVRLWSAHGRGSPVVLEGHTSPVRTATWSVNGGRVLSVSKKGELRIWKMDDLSAPLVFRGSWRGATPSPDGRSVLEVDGSRAWIQALEVPEEPAVLRQDDEPGHELPDLMSDGRRATAPSLMAESEAVVWDMGEKASSITLKGHEAKVNTSVFGPDGRQVVTASDDHTARVWNADGQGEPVVLRGHSEKVTAAVMSPDGRRVATASWDGTARVWNADGSGRPVVFRARGAQLESVAFSPDGSRVAVGDIEGVVRIWNADGTGRRVILHGHRWGVNAVAFSPDGLRVVSAAEDETARIWEVDGSGSPIVLSGHSRGLLSASFSPDGSRVVTASMDGTARVWSADGEGGAIVLPVDEDFFWQARFTADGDHVLTLVWNQPFRVWTVNGALIVSKSCAAAGRNLTRREWNALFPDRPHRATCPEWPLGSP